MVENERCAISDGFLENFGEKHEKGLKVISDQ